MPMKEELSKESSPAERPEEAVETVQTTPDSSPVDQGGESSQESLSAAPGNPAADEARAGAAAVPPAASTPVTATAPSPARQTVGWWALLIALAASGLAGWSAWQARDTHGQADELKETLARRLASSESLGNEARTIARQQQEVIAQLQGKLGALEAKLESTEGQASTLENMYQEFSRSRDSRVAAEVQQAVTLAAQQLQLAGNVEAALVALNQADSRLAAHDRGQYAPLRRALARDIESLRLLQVLDVPGLGLRLERLLERVEQLPLSFETELAATRREQAAAAAAPQAAGTRWYDQALAIADRFSSELWGEVSNLIRLERLDQVDPVLLAPAQSTFLRENLKVRLLSARLALLAHDGRSYAADLDQATQMIERFFDRDHELVRDSLNELNELKAVNLRRELPTLTDTFAALRMMQTDGEGAGDSGVVPSPASPDAGGQQ